MEPTNNPAPVADNGKIAGIVSYFSIIGWLIAYFAFHKDNKTELGSYQLRQTLLFNIAVIIIYFVLNAIIVSLIFSGGFLMIIYLFYLVEIGLFVIWIIGLIGAINGEKKPIPLIGEKAQTMFPGI